MAKIKYMQLKSNPNYDGDSGKFFEHDTLVPPVDGSIAAPSDSTLLKFLNAQKERPRIYTPKENIHEIGVYPLDGRKPFMDTSDRELDGELPYTNHDEFAFAVATRILMRYRMATKINHEDSEILEKLVIDEKRKRYRLPDKFLAMDVLLCAEYCPKEFWGYISKNKNLAAAFIEISRIKHFKARKGSAKEKIAELAKRKEEVMFF